MTGHKQKPDPKDDAALEQESSSVRQRVHAPLAIEPSDTRARYAGPRDIEPRDIEALVRMGRAVLGALPPSHPRARLLEVALVRRDEALLSVLIDEIGPRESRRSTLLPPPRRK